MTTVMTIGCQDRTVDELIAALAAAGVKVLVGVGLTLLSGTAGLRHRSMLVDALIARAGAVETIHL
jgi:hypothetical protein